jgi:nicotinate-nucleotide--dimethylbenzimidazole phosphoribosyltransferase
VTSKQYIAEVAPRISPVSESWRLEAQARLDRLTKPLGSLGQLEAIAAQFIAIRQGEPVLPLEKAVYVFAADHGITAEGVSAYPSAVTQQMVLNFLAGGAAINVLARQHGVGLHVVDVGVDAAFEDAPGLLHHKVARGTANMLHQPAMSDEQLTEALGVGAELASQAAAAGVTLLAIGEMGIGNTTSASAITCALTGASPQDATGRGTGLDEGAHARKIEIIAATLTNFERRVAAPTALEILRHLGGLEIAAMTGMVLAAAQQHVAVVADGFISTAAAALAAEMVPNCRGYLFAGHQSEEPGHRLLLEQLRLRPILNLNMRLGEGSGAVLAMPMIESALALYSGMATFASAGVNEATP